MSLFSFLKGTGDTPANKEVPESSSLTNAFDRKTRDDNDQTNNEYQPDETEKKLLEIVKSGKTLKSLRGKKATEPNMKKRKSDVLDLILGDSKHDEEDDQTLSKPEKLSKKEKEENKKLKLERNEAEVDRTIYVGNLPLKLEENYQRKLKKDLKKLFSPFGEIESLRIKQAALTDSKAPAFRKLILGEINTNVKDTLSAYIVFKETKSVQESLALNGNDFNGNHLRVDTATPTLNEDRTIFVGNLPFKVSEEQLYQHFSVCGNVSAVRIIRDPKTKSGKGIAFVTFESSVALLHARDLNETEFEDRTIRVKFLSEKGDQKKKKKKSQAPVNLDKLRDMNIKKRLEKKGETFEVNRKPKIKKNSNGDKTERSKTQSTKQDEKQKKKDKKKTSESEESSDKPQSWQGATSKKKREDKKKKYIKRKKFTFNRNHSKKDKKKEE